MEIWSLSNMCFFLPKKNVGKTNVVGFILKLSDILEDFHPHLDKSGRSLVAQMFQSGPAFLLYVFAMCQNVHPTMPFRLKGGSPGTEADL